MQFHAFDVYLTKKKINPRTLANGEQALYERLAAYFLASGEQNFTYEKLFLLNPLRRRYPLADAQMKKRTQ